MHISFNIPEPLKRVQALHVVVELLEELFHFLRICSNNSHAFTMSAGWQYSPSRISFVLSYPSSVKGNPSMSFLTCFSRSSFKYPDLAPHEMACIRTTSRGSRYANSALKTREALKSYLNSDQGAVSSSESSDSPHPGSFKQLGGKNLV